MSEWYLAVDIGGTFTDVVLLDASGTTTVLEKVLTTPKEPAAGVMDGVRRALTRAGAACPSGSTSAARSPTSCWSRRGSSATPPTAPASSPPRR